MAYYLETYVYHGLLPTTYSSLMNIFASYSIAETTAVEMAVLNNRRRNLSNISGNATTFKNSLLAEQVRKALLDVTEFVGGPQI
jgi:hypothetical protein